MQYRAAAFDVKGRKTSATLSVIFRFACKTARQESSKFYSDLRNASSLALTKYYCINFHCSTVTMPIKLSSYVTWSTSETVASVQLPLNAVFFCLAEVVSHVILWRQCSRSIRRTYRLCAKLICSKSDLIPWLLLWLVLRINWP